MIIDTHTHLYKEFTGVEALPIERFVEILQNQNVSKAWCFTLEGFYGNHKEANDRLYRLTKLYPEMLIPFCTVAPQTEDVLKEMERCADKLGMKGLKFHTWLQAFTPTHPLMPPVVKKCVELGWPIVCHDGTPPYASSFQIAYLASLNPKVKVILGHSGLHDLWKEALEAAKAYPNVYLSTCGADYWALKVMVKEVGAKRILFGSDHPFGGEESLWVELETVFRLPISEEEKNLILGENAEHFLV